MNKNILALFAVVLLCACTKYTPVFDYRIYERAKTPYNGLDSYDKREDVFSKYGGSDTFIQKFKLTDDEIEIVGKWYKIFVNHPEEGIGYSIGFLPNRVFIAASGKSFRDAEGEFLYEERYYKIGFWKIERGKLKIRFLYRYIVRGDLNPDALIVGEKKKTRYYPIWEPLYHHKIAFQLTPFHYEKIPQKIKEFYHISNTDYARHRNVAVLRFNNDHAYDCTLYEETQPWHTFLMNPDLDNEQYIYNLLVMYVMGYLKDQESYDKYGLDFSKWQ